VVGVGGAGRWLGLVYKCWGCGWGVFLGGFWGGHPTNGPVVWFFGFSLGSGDLSFFFFLLARVRGLCV